MARKPYQLPPGVRFLTEAELSARRTAAVEGKLRGAEREAVGGGVSFGQLLRGARRRAKIRRRRIPRGIWTRPR